MTDKFKADLLVKEVRHLLETRFGIRVRLPLVLDFFSGRPWSMSSAPSRLAGSLGHYHLRDLGDKKVHFVFVQKGLPRTRFKAIFAHEYTHAFLRERGILRHSRGLREGLARWVEYKVLLKEGAAREAEKLLKIRNWWNGRGLREILEMERRYSEDGLVASLQKWSEK